MNRSDLAEITLINKSFGLLHRLQTVVDSAFLYDDFAHRIVA